MTGGQSNAAYSWHGFSYPVTAPGEDDTLAAHSEVASSRSRISNRMPLGAVVKGKSRAINPDNRKLPTADLWLHGGK